MRRTVLIVDDDQGSRASLRGALERLGWEVIGEGRSGDEAVSMTKTLRPDALIIAVGLPDQDGIVASAKIMEEVPTAIVILTSRTDRETIERARDVGVIGYLLKPLREEELLPTLELAISRFQEFMTLRRENETLKKTLEARKLIERAKGLLMEQEGLSEREAFAKIQRKSMDSRTPMVEVAKAIILAAEVTGGGR